MGLPPLVIPKEANFGHHAFTTLVLATSGFLGMYWLDTIKVRTQAAAEAATQLG